MTPFEDSDKSVFVTYACLHIYSFCCVYVDKMFNVKRVNIPFPLQSKRTISPVNKTNFSRGLGKKNLLIVS
jgi:hypothetical protein